MKKIISKVFDLLIGIALVIPVLYISGYSYYKLLVI